MFLFRFAYCMFESGHFMLYVSCHPIGGIYLLCVLKIWILCLSVVCQICRVAGMDLLMWFCSMDLLMWFMDHYYLEGESHFCCLMKTILSYLISCSRGSILICFIKSLTFGNIYIHAGLSLFLFFTYCRKVFVFKSF